MKDLLSSPTALLLLIGLVFVTSAVALFYFLRNRSNSYATPLERATFGTLHTVALASPSLREGLSPSSAALPETRCCARRRRAVAASSASGWRWPLRSSAPTTPR